MTSAAGGCFRSCCARCAGSPTGTACDIASVASRFVLDLPGVAAVIVGATSRAHLAANVAAGALTLTDADRAEIEAVASAGGSDRRCLRARTRPQPAGTARS